MGFGEAISTCFKKYVDFSGRARRSEYWYFYLFFIIIYAVLFAIVAAAGNAIPLIILLAFVLPTLAAGIRRLHDTGRSGWFILIGLIPFVGGIILIVFACQDSQPGDNQYGPNPKGVGGQGFQGYGAPGGYPPPAGY